jgi:hypothetical protein
MRPTLFEKLSALTDVRRSEGKRHSANLIIVITILALVSQVYTLRGIAEFAKRHREVLTEMFKLKHKTPSYSPIRAVLNKVNFGELSKIIYEWLLAEGLINPHDPVSLDGKCIKSTLTDYNSSTQNFASIVTVFSHNSGIALLSEKFENKKRSEIEVVRDLIKELKLEGIIITLDALHAKKNS